MSNRFRLTVAIPTHNRARYLETALESLRAQANSSPDWSILVVDNGCTDATEALLAGVTLSWPRVRSISVSTLGAAIARNAALAAADADFILYVDDECKFPPGYIDRALAIAQRGPVMFGGPIYPWHIVPPPAWFYPELGSFSLPVASVRAERIYLSAGNLGFSVQALVSIGGFASELGPRGAVMAYGEETDVETRMIKSFGEEEIYYDPEFYNYHVVRPEKAHLGFNLVENFRRGVARGLLAQRHIDTASVPVPPALRRGTHSGERSVRTLPQEAAHLTFGLARKLGYWSFKAGIVRY